MKNNKLWLTLAIVAVWAALAAVYALVPGIPGYVRVWGGDAMLFLVLAGVLVVAGRKARRT